MGVSQSIRQAHERRRDASGAINELPEYIETQTEEIEQDCFRAGWTAAMLASANGHEDCLKLVIAAGMNLEHQNEDGCTAAMLASANGHEGCLRLLNAAGVNFEHRDKDGWTAAMLAAWNGQEGCLRLLTAEGADLGHQEEKGDTALHLACRGKQLEVAKWLVEQMSRDAALALNWSGESAVQVWGIPSVGQDKEAEVEDEGKDAFCAHVELLFIDVK